MGAYKCKPPDVSHVMFGQRWWLLPGQQDSIEGLPFFISMLGSPNHLSAAAAVCLQNAQGVEVALPGLVLVYDLMVAFSSLGL